jgi:hypothetical protein
VKKERLVSLKLISPFSFSFANDFILLVMVSGKSVGNKKSKNTKMVKVINVIFKTLKTVSFLDFFILRNYSFPTDFTIVFVTTKNPVNNWV